MTFKVSVALIFVVVSFTGNLIHKNISWKHLKSHINNYRLNFISTFTGFNHKSNWVLTKSLQSLGKREYIYCKKKEAFTKT